MDRRSLLAGIGALVLVGCREDDGTAPIAAEALPPLELSDASDDILLTWIDEHGDTHTEIRASDVPPAHAQNVRVVVTSAAPGARSSLYLADLSQKDERGHYPVRTAPRNEWEALIAARRGAVARPAATAAPTASVAPSPAAVQAIIYGAEWCGPCHDAARYLKRRGVAVTERDIEKDARARAEMNQKLRTAGRAGASTIPIIDIAGIVLVGYSPAQVDQALARAQRATTL